MKKNKRLPIIIAGSVAGALVIAVFSVLLYVIVTGNIVFSGSVAADAPHEELNGEATVTPEAPAPEQEEPQSGVLAAPPAPDNPQIEEPAAPAQAPRPQPLPPDTDAYRVRLTGNDFVTVRMDRSDIHSGFLVLVNSDHKYDIPDDLDLVTITSARNTAYRVNSTYRKLHRSIMKPLNDMMQSFADETENTVFRRQNAYMYIISAFRDYNEQRRELNDQIYLQGQAAALARTKQPGYSEHHTGFAFDLATVIDGVQHPFDHFDLTKWFSRNSYKYGFILRYASNKTSVTKTIYEPWHYRYVGLPHSYLMYDRNWALEEYIEKIREYTAQEPLKVSYGGVDYEVFFTGSSDIAVPANANYDISGNNVDGYIVTIYERYDRLTNVAGE